jgi:hypothetical protein
MKSLFRPSFSKTALYAGLAAAILILPTAAPATVLFSDNFNSGASPQWGNQSGNWTASGGTYFAQSQGFVNSTALPFNLTDFSVDVDINHVADGGLWLRSDGTGNNGILLVTGGDGWAAGSRIGQAGRALYFHTVINGSFSPYLSEVFSVFNPTVDNPHIRVEVAGNTYSVFLNGAANPITTLSDATFSNGLFGLYDNSVQTFDNFVLATVPEPSTAALLGLAVGFTRLRTRQHG